MAPPDLNRVLDVARDAALAAGGRLRRAFRGTFEVLEEGGKDVKISCDREAEAEIVARLQAGCPGVPVVAEESWDRRAALPAHGWVVDPLDGTFNFSRGIPVCCTSIAYWADGRARAGVIYDFVHDELFHGAPGAGCWLGTQPVHVSTITGHAQATLGGGFSSGRSYDAASLGAFIRQVQDYKKLRFVGAAAVGLAWVACGRFDAYEEDDTYIWDVAAGLALIEAAGGACFTRPGRSPVQLHLRAGNGRLPPGPWPA